MFETIFKQITPDCEPRVLEQTIQLAVELAREGREGHKIGTKKNRRVAYIFKRTFLRIF